MMVQNTQVGGTFETHLFGLRAQFLAWRSVWESVWDVEG